MKWFCGNLKKYKKTYIVLFAFTALLYSVFMIHLLTNVGDGFWQQNYYIAGDTETASGRWLWPYFDKLAFGVHIDPVASLISLAVFVASFILVLMALNLEDERTSIIGGLIFFSSPIFSAVMAYRFMSFAYAMASFLACLGALLCIKLKNNVAAVLSAAAAIACFMGLYQAYLGTFCLIGVISLISLCIKEESTVKDILTRMIRFLVAVPVGGALYYVVLKIHLSMLGAELSDYNGVGQISVGSIIMALPRSAIRVNRLLFYYFKGNVMKMGALDSKIRLTLIFNLIFGTLLLTLIAHAMLKMKTNRVVRLLVMVFCFILVPISCNMANIIAPDAAFMEQMGLPMMLLSALMPMLSFKLKEYSFGSNSKLMPLVIALIALSVVTIYSQAAQVLIDHSAMQEGYTATRTLASGVYSDLQKQGLLNKEKKFFFIGTPADNETFYTTEVFDRANDYARIGDFWLEGSCMCGTYKSLFQRVMGVDIEVLSDPYESKAYDEYYQTVPCYPYDGYILDWDTVIVKISEP